MDINKIIARAKAVLTQPKLEWPVIAQEPATVADLYKGYIVLLAAIPAVAGFIKASILGISIPFAGTVRVGFGTGLTGMVTQYVLSLVVVFVVALVVEALAPTFGGQKDRTQALKTVAYSMTAAWLAGIAVLLPGLGTLIALIGGIYGIYLLYLGLPHTMKAPQEKAAGYTVVTIIVAIVANVIVMYVASAITGVGTSTRFAGSAASIDQDSPLGRLEQWGKEVEQASKKLEEAQQSGDQEAQAAALGAMMGAAMGGGGKVEALPSERLRPFLPEQLNGLERTDFSAERTGAFGLQVSQARASYAADDRSLELEIIDTASARALLAAAGFTGMESESESDGMRERVYRDRGRLVREMWDSNSQYGEYSVLVGDRFTVKIEGNARNLAELKSALGAVNLAGLEALKNEGVER